MPGEIVLEGGVFAYTFSCTKSKKVISSNYMSVVIGGWTARNMAMERKSPLIECKYAY